MGDDVICIESDEDEDEEADDEAGSSRRTPRPRPRGVRGGGGKQQARSASTSGGGGGYWRQWRNARAARRKRDLNGGGIGEQSTVAWLQGELERLRTGMHHGSRKSDPTVRCALACQVVHRVRELVQEFQCRTAASAAAAAAAAVGATSTAIDSCRPSTERTECWRHVLQFLLRTGPHRKFDPKIGSLHRLQQKQQDICDDRASNSSAKRQQQKEVQREHRRYQLTVIDILVDYIRFRCQEMVAQVAATTVAANGNSKATQPSTPGLSSARLLLAECNRIVSALFVIFDGDMEPVTLTLLHLDTTDPGSRYTLLLYPLFESILRHPGSGRGQCTIKAEAEQTDGGSWISCPTIPCYVRMLLCFQRWKSLVSSRADRAVIEGYAVQLMPARCPTVQLTADVAFLRLLPAIPAAHRTSETRFLLASEGLFELEHCIGQYMYHYRRTFCRGGDGSVPSPSLATTIGVPASPCGAPFRLSNHRKSTETGSNYINVRLLAELIERKSGLGCAEHERGQREQEVDSLVNAMRLIFRNRLEFCELTLLQIRLGPLQPPRCQLVMTGVFEALLTPRTPLSSPEETATGRAIYRSNDVETYGRLMLCYAKWKALYRWLEDGDGRTRQWARIDAIALSQLPNDFPRSICPRDALLRRILRPMDGDALLTTFQRQRQRRQSVTPTRFFLQTLPERADLQELCYKFLAASRCHPDGTSPGDSRERHDTHLPWQTSIAYQSLDSIIGGSSNRAQGSSTAQSLAASASSTLQASECTIVGAELTATEMKPIIIPDSSGTDGRGSVLLLSVSGNITDPSVHLPSGRAKSTLVCEPTPHRNTNYQSTTIPASEVQTSKSFAAYGATQPTSGDDGPLGNSAVSANTTTVLDGDGALTSGPEWAECFLNTPPATPQQQPQHHQQMQQQEVLPSELLVVEEERNQNVAQQQHDSLTGCRLPRPLKATLEAIPSRRKGRCQRQPEATAITIPTVRRALGKRRVRRGRGQRRSKQAAQWPSIMKIGCISSSSSTTTEMTLSGTDAKREDRSKDELLLELLGCGEEEGTTEQQPDIDFAIPPDHPTGFDLELETVEHQAPPSTLIDTSASIFGTEADGDGSFVLLFTEPDGPFYWPVGL